MLEQLGRVTPVVGKSMFGGVGIYAQGLFFALIAEDRLYFKVNATTRLEFEQRGMEPFRPFGEDSAMGYYEVPADVAEDVVLLQLWMRKAIDVAATAKRGKSKRPKRAAVGGAAVRRCSRLDLRHRQQPPIDQGH